MKIQDSNINFKGIIFSDTVKLSDIKKVEKFITNKENLSLIEALENNKTDVFLKQDFSKLSFIHKKYGDLFEYGIVDVSVDQFAKSKNLILNKLAKVLAKAELISAKKGQETYERRGC